MTPTSIGNWTARYRDPDTNKQVYKTLKDYSDFPDNERYDLAQKEALAWFKHLGRGGLSESLTIKDVCLRYAEHLKHEKSLNASNDAIKRFNRYVFDNVKFSKIEVTKLKPLHIENWKKSLRETPIKSGVNKGKARSDSTLNRDITCLRSALNFAYKKGLLTNDFPWKSILIPAKNADRKRSTYLDLDQRKKLISSCPKDLAEFIKCSCFIPLRCGAIAKLTVSNYDRQLQTLTIEKDKANSNRKISLPKNLAIFIEKNIQDKLPTAPIFSRPNGDFWSKDSWKYPIKDAVRKAGLPANVTMYTIRHSVITDLIHGGLDSLTVAQLSGTSILMIEKHYGHLTKAHAKEALSRLII